jgi:hypothetical protein
MCGLCGIFQKGPHWTDAAGSPSADARRTRRGERLRRVAITNRVLKHYGLKLADWHGDSYVLSTQTGRSEIVDNIAAVWPLAEKLRKRRLDPLDQNLIAALEREEGAVPRPALAGRGSSSVSLPIGDPGTVFSPFEGED